MGCGASVTSNGRVDVARLPLPRHGEDFFFVVPHDKEIRQVRQELDGDKSAFTKSVLRMQLSNIMLHCDLPA